MDSFSNKAQEFAQVAEEYKSVVRNFTSLLVRDPLVKASADFACSPSSDLLTCLREEVMHPLAITPINMKLILISYLREYLF